MTKFTLKLQDGVKMQCSVSETYLIKNLFSYSKNTYGLFTLEKKKKTRKKTQKAMFQKNLA